ncbi:cob(I)yrinic acid a,c-diamide adenosyltransferase [Wenyingzhuangia sp. 2_MG-2023]|uniref:cob(I)yrinic acid a,c-diamide adenosyltransferase n=1 Tax=Wenyingzhuangia sp. 2_MG-2023 TaxID=3062639 RepID=UPI0026E341F0|nr:cob(I)yrinic acid a,c-diamide adenosyltransferase [Wenyingzhuangia sp. 2_MG-2023]MDO6738635.1 cob(I)yrinic acid a,c-diamide adenosyltransferase [Wenyingzhuangia sp. 2_MG-2023]
MKIYTKTGDSGETSLFGGKRVSKSDLRIDAYGTIDELNAYVGLLRDSVMSSRHQDFLLEIQNNLFVVGAFLATPPESQIKKNGENRLKIDNINEETLKKLEDEIDALEAQLPTMTHFILPGGHTTVSHCHIARTICRRAERVCVQLQKNEFVSADIIGYLNRLSDYLFVLARMLTKELQVEEIKWISASEK